MFAGYDIGGNTPPIVVNDAHRCPLDWNGQLMCVVLFLSKVMNGAMVTTAKVS